LTRTQWLICFIASVGFAFDIYELLMLPLIIKPALAALGGTAPGGGPILVPGSEEFTRWARLLFFVPALIGGAVGLVGGYLTDRLGRRRVLTGSILLCPLGLRFGLREDAHGAPRPPLLRLHRSLRRVRGGGRLARRALPGPEAAGEGPRL
jgi:MFS family permease